MDIVAQTSRVSGLKKYFIFHLEKIPFRYRYPKPMDYKICG